MPADMPQRDLKHKVYDWVRGEGYPLELRVARALGHHGWEFVLGAKYKDPHMPGTVREIDVLATRSRWLDNRGVPEACAELTLLIECKSSPSKPWVLFALDESDDDASMNMSDDMPSEFDLIPVGDAARSALAVTPIVGHPGFETLHVWMRHPATSIVEAFRDRKGTDNAYGASMSALGAALSVAATPPADEESDTQWFQYCVPVVVIEGQLFRYSMTPGEDLDQLNEVGIASVLTEHAASASQSASQSSHAVHVVTYSAWDEFLASVTRDADALNESLVGSRAAYRKLQRHLSKRRPRRAT